MRRFFLAVLVAESGIWPALARTDDPSHSVADIQTAAEAADLQRQ